MHSLKLRYIILIGLLPLGCGIGFIFAKSLISHIVIILFSTLASMLVALYLYALHCQCLCGALNHFKRILNGDFMPPSSNHALFKEDALIVKQLDEAALAIRTSLNSLCKEIDHLATGNTPTHISTPLLGDYRQLTYALNKLCFSIRTDKSSFTHRTKKLEDNAKNTFICSQRVHEAYTQQLKVAKDVLRCLALTQDSFTLCKNYSGTLGKKKLEVSATIKSLVLMKEKQTLQAESLQAVCEQSQKVCHELEQLSSLNNQLTLFSAVEASSKQISPEHMALVSEQCHNLSVKCMHTLKEMRALHHKLTTYMENTTQAIQILLPCTQSLTELQDSQHHLLSLLLEQIEICSKETDSCAKNALTLIKSLETNSKQTQNDIEHVSEGINNIATEIKQTSPNLSDCKSTGSQRSLLHWVEEEDKYF